MNIENGNRKPFGEILKEVRINNGDSFRSLADKIDIIFSYIDKLVILLFMTFVLNVASIFDYTFPIVRYLGKQQS